MIIGIGTGIYLLIGILVAKKYWRSDIKHMADSYEVFALIVLIWPIVALEMLD